MPEWILELSSELPVLGLALGFMYFWNRHMTAAEARHSAERKDIYDSFMAAIKRVSGECHASQDRGSASLSQIAEGTSRTEKTMARIGGQIDTLITIARGR